MIESDAGAVREDTKPVANEILDCLEEIILRDGFADLKMSEPAAELCCAKKDIYALAHSKKELVLMVLERFFQRIRDEGDVAIQNIQEPERRIYEYLQAGVRGAQKLSPKVVTDIDKWVPARQIWQEHIRLRVEGLNTLVEEGLAQGVFKGVQARLVSETMLAMANRFRDPNFYQNTDMNVGEAFRDFYKILVEALLHAGDAER